MRKKYLLFAAVLGVLTSCDPLKDEGDFDITNISSEQLLNGATFEQYSATKNEDGTLSYTADPAGNYIKFNIPAVSSVTIYYVKPDGSETILSKGFAGGMFNYTPKRGSDPVQTLYFRYINQDGEEVVASKEFTLTVATALTPEMRLLASDSYGKKIWKWDTDFREDGAVWGNMGYAPGDGESFVNAQNGIWWGCPPADLTGQLGHSDTGVATGEEDPNAYMTFDFEDGTIETFNAAGEKVRGGTFEIQNWGMGERTQATVDGSQAAWALGTLHTTEGAILWPFQINGNGNKPTDFEIMQADNDHLKLIYAAPGTGGWAEATWWAFKKK